MGTDIVIAALLDNNQEEILVTSEKIILDFEKRFSRFVDGNELSIFNQSLYQKREVSPMLLELLKEIKYYYVETKGVFDPTIINSLEAVGYNKSFDKINLATNAKNKQHLDIDKVKLDFNTRSKLDELKIEGALVDCPKNLKIDLGGIGKGYIVDFLSKDIFLGVENYWISAGGDLIAVGNDVNQIGWDIDVQNPFEPDKDIFFINTQGKKTGIATSGIIKRTGFSGDFKWNHIIDSRTGLPIENNILSVTALSSSVTRADIFAKTVLILGEEKGLEFINNKLDAACIIFTKDKKIIYSNQAKPFLKKYEEK
jgi:thiamine biosynthesis lipoprotein